MFNKKFIHNDPDIFHGHELTLHDCETDKILFKNGILYFNLPDGFWVTPEHKANEYKKVVRTGPAIVKFTINDIDDIHIRMFTQKTKVKIWNMEQLINAVNSGKYLLEFITQYRAHAEQMWLCDITSKRKPYYKECQLYLPETEASFHWNELRPEREW